MNLKNQARVLLSGKNMAEEGRPTIHDIAEMLSITASTVSRALNNSPRVSASTRERVLKAAQQLNYQPNPIAAALRHGRSHIIAVMVPALDRSFFASVVRGVEEIANDLGYKVIVSQTYDNYQKEVQAIKALLHTRVDGILVSIGKNTEDFSHFKEAQAKGIPVVLFDRSNDLLEVSQVVIDDYLGAKQMVAHLIGQGCKRIAHFTSNKRVSIYKERLRGYTDALLEHQIPFDERLVIPSNLQLEDGRAGMETLLEMEQTPDAVFSASDYGALGAMQVLHEHDIPIPGKVALAGFSNEPFTAFTYPSLTTVNQFSLTMGIKTAELFFSQLQSNNQQYVPQKMVLKPELIIRQSSLRKKMK